MNIPLSDQDSFDLTNIHKGTKEKRVADKIKCIRMLSENFPKSTIASLLEVDEKTVYNWRREFLESKSIVAFVSNLKGNYQGKLSEEKKTPL